MVSGRRTVEGFLTAGCPPVEGAVVNGVEVIPSPLDGPRAERGPAPPSMIVKGGATRARTGPLVMWARVTPGGEGAPPQEDISWWVGLSQHLHSQFRRLPSSFVMARYILPSKRTTCPSDHVTSSLGLLRFLPKRREQRLPVASDTMGVSE
jgi:hypothetical protein